MGKGHNEGGNRGTIPRAPKYCKNTVTFLLQYSTVYSAHNENKMQYPGIDMYIGEPLV